jgi:Protein of unknown function (DUF4232)
MTSRTLRLSRVGVASVLSAMLLTFVAGTPHRVAALAANAFRTTSGRPCSPADLSATLVLLRVGEAPTSLVGAVIFSDTSSRPCTLAGTPKVRVAGPTGETLAVFQAPATRGRARPVPLAGADSAAGGALPDAGASITWSDWNCVKNSFALVVRFTGWRRSMTVPWGVTTGYAGTPCSAGQATVYVGPVARVAAPV